MSCLAISIGWVALAAILGYYFGRCRQIREDIAERPRCPKCAADAKTAWLDYGRTKR